MHQFTDARPWRVTLQADAGDKFKIHFDCFAVDADETSDAARKAHPGCVVLHEAQIEGYVIYAASEDDGDANGFWSGTLGWASFSAAQMFAPQEAETLSLPMSARGDAKWVLVSEGCRICRGVGCPHL